MGVVGQHSVGEGGRFGFKERRERMKPSRAELCERALTGEEVQQQLVSRDIV